MSRALKCDRCGRYFENQSLAEDQVICATVDMLGNVKVERHIPWKGTIEHACCCTAKLIDLCPECADSFGDWLNGHYNQEPGRWLDCHGNYKCSDCGTEFSDEIIFIEAGEIKFPKYCPHCGLEKRQEDDDGQ